MEKFLVLHVLLVCKLPLVSLALKAVEGNLDSKCSTWIETWIV